jgi:hypothetical protein
MERKIKIVASGIEAEALLNETDIASKVWENLPITSKVATWGDEIYFSTPVEEELEEAREVVELGDIAYWPQGKAICIFFGKTPKTRGDEIRPVGPVSLIGKVKGDLRVFKNISPGSSITIERG